MDKTTARVMAWKDMAEVFLNDGKKVFIKDFNDDYYFAEILLVGEDTLTIQCFAPVDRDGKKYTLYWKLIQRFAEYREEI